MTGRKGGGGGDYKASICVCVWEREGGGGGGEKERITIIQAGPRLKTFIPNLSARSAVCVCVCVWGGLHNVTEMN